jgi:hypothetical protein
MRKTICRLGKISCGGYSRLFTRRLFPRPLFPRPFVPRVKTRGYKQDAPDGALCDID